MSLIFFPMVVQSQGQNLFVREEMKKHLKSEKKLQEQIHLGRELGNCQHTEQGNPHFRTQLFKDKTGKVLHVSKKCLITAVAQSLLSLFFVAVYE